MAVTNLDTSIANTSAVLQPAEHGVGFIGTEFAPRTYRRTENGVIITQIKFDITGLISSTTDGDITALAAGAAYFGKNVVAKNGIIFKTEFTCLETPLTGITNMDVSIMASGALLGDADGGTDVIATGGVLLIGQTVINLIPTIPANYYYYLIAGAGGTNDTYTAGQYMFTTWGHPLLT